MPRETGKTTSLMKMSLRTGARIVTKSKRGAQLIKERAENEPEFVGLKDPISFGEFLNHRLPGEKYLIDDLDMCRAKLKVIGYANDSDTPALVDYVEKMQVAESERKIVKKEMKLDDIRITRAFKDSMPISSKVTKCYDHYRETGTLDRELVINKANYLQDGYDAYLVCKMVGLENVEVTVKTTV
jgi:hypothetical protein